MNLHEKINAKGKEEQKIFALRKELAYNEMQILRCNSKIADILCDLTESAIERIGATEYYKQMNELSVE